MGCPNLSLSKLQGKIEMEIRGDMVRLRLDTLMFARFSRGNIQNIFKWIPPELQESVREVLRREGFL